MSADFKEDYLESEEDSQTMTIREELDADLKFYFGAPYYLESDKGPIIAKQMTRPDGKTVFTAGLNESIWSHPTPGRCAQLAARTVVRMFEDGIFEEQVVPTEDHEFRLNLTIKDDPKVWDKYIQPFLPHNLFPLMYYGLTTLRRYRLYLELEFNTNYTDFVLLTVSDWLEGLLNAIDNGQIHSSDDDRPLLTRFSAISEGDYGFADILSSLILEPYRDESLLEVPSLESDIDSVQLKDESAVARIVWRLCNPEDDVIAAVSQAGYVQLFDTNLTNAAFALLRTRSENYDNLESENENFNQAIAAIVDGIEALYNYQS